MCCCFKVAKTASISDGVLAESTITRTPSRLAAAWKIHPTVPGAGIARIDENAKYRRLRHQFAQYFELLAAERGGKQTNACDIAAGPIETGDKS